MEDFRAQWVAALERLELDVGNAEQMLAERQRLELEPWVPPTLRAPIPDDLVPRARLIHERQLAVAHAMTQQVSSTTQRLSLTMRMRALVIPDVPVYIDLSA